MVFNGNCNKIIFLLLDNFNIIFIVSSDRFGALFSQFVILLNSDDDASVSVRKLNRIWNQIK